MPWKESSVMDERMRFVIRLKDGESMAGLCREFEISRKTGYKIFERYEQCGLEGLSDRTRRPFRYANQLPEQVEAAIVATLAGQAVGIKEVDNGIWLVSFMDYDLGYIDLEEKTLQPLENPFGPKVLPMS